MVINIDLVRTTNQDCSVACVGNRLGNLVASTTKERINMVNGKLILDDLKNHYVAELPTVRDRWVRKIKAKACQQIALMLRNSED